MRLGEELHAIDVVEAACTAACHLHVLLLVLANGHLGSAVLQNVGRHESGVGEQAGVHIVGLLASLLLEGGDTLKFTQVAVHIEVKIEFKRFTHIALHIDGGLLRVDAACQILGENCAHTVLDVLGLGVCGERVPVGNEEHALVLILHSNKTLHSSKVIAQVQIAGGPDSANNFFHCKNAYEY